MERSVILILFGINYLTCVTGVNVDMCKAYNQTLDTTTTLTYNNASSPNSDSCWCIVQSNRDISLRIQRASPSVLCLEGQCQSCNDTEIPITTNKNSIALFANFTDKSTQDLAIDVTALPRGTSPFQLACGIVAPDSASSKIELQSCPLVATSVVSTAASGVVPGKSEVTTAGLVIPPSRQGMDDVHIYIILVLVVLIVVILLLLVLYVVLRSDRWKAKRQSSPHILEEPSKSRTASVNGSVRTGFDPPKFETYIDAYNNESSTDPIQRPSSRTEVKNQMNNNNYYLQQPTTNYQKNESSTDDIDDNFLIHQARISTLPREIQLIDRALEHEPGYMTVDSKQTTDTSGYQTTDSRHSQQRMSTFQSLDIVITDNKTKPQVAAKPIVTSPGGKHSMKDYKWEHAENVAQLQIAATYSHDPAYKRQVSQESEKASYNKQDSHDSAHILYKKQDSHESTHIPFMMELKQRQARRDSGIEDNTPETDNKRLTNPAYHSDTDESDNADGAYSQIGQNSRQAEPPQGMPKVFRNLFYADAAEAPDDSDTKRSKYINPAYTDDAETGEREQSPPASVYMGNFILRPKGANLSPKRPSQTTRSAGHIGAEHDMTAKEPDEQPLSQSVIDVNSNFILRRKSPEPLKNTPRAKERTSPSSLYALPSKRNSDPDSEINYNPFNKRKSPMSDGEDQELSNLNLSLPPPEGFGSSKKEIYHIEPPSPSSPPPPVPPPPQLETPSYHQPTRKNTNPRTTTSTIIRLDEKVPPPAPTNPPPPITPPHPEKHLVRPKVTRPTPPPPDIGSKPPPSTHAPVAIHPKHGKYKRVKGNKLPYYQQENQESAMNSSLKQSSHLMNGNKFFAVMNDELVMVKSDGKEDVMM